MTKLTKEEIEYIKNDTQITLDIHNNLKQKQNKLAKYLLTLSQIITTILMAIALYIILKGTSTMNPIIIFNGLFVLLGSWGTWLLGIFINRGGEK